jgi:hypothetical protein
VSDAGSKYARYFFVLFRLTFHVRLAGVASTLPAASFARTLRVWRPGLTLILSGDEQGRNRPRSSLQANVAPRSVERNVNLAFFLLVFLGGPATILVFGAVASTLPPGGVGGPAGAETV